MVQGETDETATDFQAGWMARNDMSDASKRKEKQKWAVEKPKLEIASSLHGIYLIDQEMRNSKISWETLLES